MAKEWILNSATNRFQLNFKRNVGAVSEAIRACSPKNLNEWRDYYYRNVRSKDHIDGLGRRLHTKVTEVLPAEIAGISLNDCIDKMHQLVIDRTYDGYRTEIDTIHGQLAHELDLPIHPAPDEWDRGYNVDFFIEVGNKFIGIQVKPAGSTAHIMQIHSEHKLQAASHRRFTSEYGGGVFYIVSVKRGGKKVIDNPEVIEDIRLEITRLRSNPEPA